MKYEIEIEGLPEGWKPVACRVPMIGEPCFEDGNIFVAKASISPCLIVEKIKPRRIVLEETEELSDPEWTGQIWVIMKDGNIAEIRVRSDKVWREVKETDIPLTNSESKLSLSVDECRNVRSLIKDFENLGWFVNPARSLLLQKITEFIKDK